MHSGRPGPPRDARSEVLIVLDSGPLGLISNPAPGRASQDAHDWARAHTDAGNDLVVPEIADYELRRELLRADKGHGIARLDELCAGLWYEPLTTSIMRRAAELWARARTQGYPTAHDAALDGDVILSAHALELGHANTGLAVTVATTNPTHLKRHAPAALWSTI